MRIFSKKMLAVVLSVAMLVSCMVFSFSASAVTVHWSNDFNEVTSTNWSTTLSAATDYSNQTNPARVATHKPDGGANGTGDGVMSLKATEVKTEYTGFRLFAGQSTVSNYGGEYSGNEAGKFKLVGTAGYTIKFDYKLASTDHSVDLYVAAFGDANWTQESPGVNTGKHIKVATLTAAGDWVTGAAVTFAANGGHGSNGLHFYIKSSDDQTMSAEMLIDNIQVTDIVGSKVTFMYNGSVVGTSEYGNEGATVTVPTLSGVPSNVKYYSDAALTQEIDIDNLKYGATDTVVYVAEPADYIQTYDSTAFSGVTFDSDGKYQFDVTGALRGNGSGRWLSNAFAETNGNVQAMVNGWSDNLARTALFSGDGEYVQIAANTIYTVSMLVRSSEAGAVSLSLGTNTELVYNFGLFVQPTTATKLTVPSDAWTPVTLKFVSTTDTVGKHLVLATSYDDKVYSGGSGAPSTPDLYIDNVAIRTKTFTLDPDVQSFEGLTNGTSLKNISSDGGTVELSDVRTHTGAYSVLVSGFDNGGGTRTQFNIPGIGGNDYFTAKEGYRYIVTLWIYPETSNPDALLNLWVTASGADVVYADSATKDKYLLKELSSYPVVNGQWNEITFTTDVPPADSIGGVLRLGICGPTGATRTFYVDDIKITEKQSVVVNAGDPMSFEAEGVGDYVDITYNYDGTVPQRVQVSNTVAHTGTQSAYVYSATNTGRGRVQMYVTDAAGNAANIENGKSYFFTYWINVPTDAEYDFRVNQFLMAGNGSSDRNTLQNAGASLALDDEGGYNLVSKGSGWTKITKYFTANASGLLLWGFAHGASASNHCYIDDVELIEASEMVAVDQSDSSREQMMYYNSELNTHLHTKIGGTADSTPYTSIRLGGKYTSKDATGKYIVVDGEEYEIVERGIIMDTVTNITANGGLDLDHCDANMKASKTSNFEDYWSIDSNNQVTFTLRLMNMSEAWFQEETPTYQYRAYFKVKVPYHKANAGSIDNADPDGAETLTVYGGMSQAFSFKSFADGTKVNEAYWFGDNQQN